VYLAFTRSGHVCVIKDYYIQSSTKATDQERDDEEYEKKTALATVVDREEELWTKLYDGRFKARAHELGGKPCLLLTYGYEITDDTDNRWKYIPAIRDELLRFAKQLEASYVYKDSDLRWRHVLLDMEGKIFLSDLESLEEMKVATDQI
jgi:Family of unknown function (DUF5898)